MVRELRKWLTVIFFGWMIYEASEAYFLLDVARFQLEKAQWEHFLDNQEKPRT